MIKQQLEIGQLTRYCLSTKNVYEDKTLDCLIPDAKECEFWDSSSVMHFAANKIIVIQLTAIFFLFPVNMKVSSGFPKLMVD